MADMHHLIQIDGVDAPAAYTALTSQDGITGWWTSRAAVPGASVGDVLKMSFPEAPITWDMRIDKSDPPGLVEWGCIGGPPGWENTPDRLERRDHRCGGRGAAGSCWLPGGGRHVPHRHRRLGADAAVAKGVPGKRSP